MTLSRHLLAIPVLVGLANPVCAATVADIAAAMGSVNVSTLRISGTGTFAIVGQSLRAGGEWPKFRIKQAERVFDYANSALAEDIVFLPPEGAPRGGGGQPFYTEQRRLNTMRGDAAWTGAGENATAAPAQIAALQHELWISPHGVIKAALNAGTTASTGADGRTTFVVERAGRFKAQATANAANLIERVVSSIANPVLGDMTVETTYADYRTVEGVQVPTKIVQRVLGHPTFEMAVVDINLNAPPVTAPAQIRPAAPVPAATIEKVAEGVWFVAGASHHSAAIEMADHIVLVEAPLGDARTNEVIDLVKKTIPNKPLRIVVNTHHHFDHSGGLRAAAAEGMTILTHEFNRPFFEAAYAAPRTLAPDRLARANGNARFQTMGDKMVLSDSTRTLELLALKDNTHADGLIVGYLPKEKILIVADAFSPRTEVVRTPERLNPFTTNLWDNIQRLKLDVATVLPIHGRYVPVRELRIEVGQNN